MFNERLAALRKLKGLSQPELAEIAGVSVDTVRRWEGGKQDPRLGELMLLAGALGVSIEELATGQKSEAQAISIKHGDFQMDIPATPEGYLFAETKFRELLGGRPV